MEFLNYFSNVFTFGNILILILGTIGMLAWYVLEIFVGLLVLVGYDSSMTERCFLMKEKFFVSCAAQSCFFAAPYIAKCKVNQRLFFKRFNHRIVR